MGATGRRNTHLAESRQLAGRVLRGCTIYYRLTRQTNEVRGGQPHSPPLGHYCRRRNIFLTGNIQVQPLSMTEN